MINKNFRIETRKLAPPCMTDKPVPNLFRYRYKTSSTSEIAGLSARCTSRGDLKSISTQCERQQNPQATCHGDFCTLKLRSRKKEVLSVDVAGSNLRAPYDPDFQVIMIQFRRTDSPDGGFLCEQYRNSFITSWGWKKSDAEPTVQRSAVALRAHTPASWLT